MKTFKYLTIGLSISALATVSCTNFLDLKPESKLDAEYVFGSYDRMESAVMNVYNGLIEYQTGPMRSFVGSTDESLGNHSSTATNDQPRILRYNLHDGNAQIRTAFDNYYKGIERANICIKNIQESDLFKTATGLEKTKVNRLLGEALTLRAFFYFDLVKNWGDVPASFVPAVDQTDFFVEKTDRQIIYDQILEDLEQAEELLSWRGENGFAINERITKGAAKALRARIALFAGGYSLNSSGVMTRVSDWQKYYEITRKECKDIIENGAHNLNLSFKTTFQKLVKSEVDPAGEIIMEIAFQQGVSGQNGYFNGPRFKIASGTSTTTVGGAQIYILPTLIYKYGTNDDERLHVTMGPYIKNYVTGKFEANGSTILNGKFRLDWIQGYRSTVVTSGLNWPLIRYADVLLMFAEADAELTTGGDGALVSAEAITAFEAVRKRAYASAPSNIGITPSTKQAFIEAVKKERLLEFVGEGIRKYDLIRWNQLASTIDQVRDELTKMKNGDYETYPATIYAKTEADEFEVYSYFDNTGRPTSVYNLSIALSRKTVATNFLNAFASHFEAGKCELFPFPITALNANPKLEQNLGYK